MTRSPVIVPIVEGDGEVKAVPLLLRRVLGERHGRYDIAIQRPINAKGKPNLLRNFERFLGLARKFEECDAVLVLLDGDKDCPRELTTGLAQSAAGLNMSVPVAVVCAHREYEAWFVASLDSETGDNIRATLGLSESEVHEGDVELVTSPKGWIQVRMPQSSSYKETQHQPALTEYIDIEHTQRRSRSFRRLCHAVEELLCAIESGTPIVTPHTCGNGGCLPDALARHHRSR